ncbi:MAG: hypothetical protein VW835_01815, partial [Rickettsiales bacterium]
DNASERGKKRQTGNDKESGGTDGLLTHHGNGSFEERLSPEKFFHIRMFEGLVRRRHDVSVWSYSRLMA